MTGVPGAHLRVVHMGGTGFTELWSTRALPGGIDTDPNTRLRQSASWWMTRGPTRNSDGRHHHVLAEPATVPSGPIQGSKISSARPRRRGAQVCRSRSSFHQDANRLALPGRGGPLSSCWRYFLLFPLGEPVGAAREPPLRNLSYHPYVHSCLSFPADAGSRTDRVGRIAERPSKTKRSKQR